MTPLEHALAYATLGWRVAPIPPGEKYPRGIGDWQNQATTNPDRITRWWTAHPDHGVCIATGPDSGVIAIDIDSYAGGDEGWAELEQVHGPAPETVEAVTGGGGRHLLFAHPAGGPPITNAAHALPPGVDVRGDGGQIVAAPTIHPRTGHPYVWEIEHDPLNGHPVADIPSWLLALLRAPLPEQLARRDVTPYAGTDSIIELFASRHTWPELLETAGWTFHSARNTVKYGAFELWTRPGKDPRHGPSASLYAGGSDVLKVFTKMAPPLVQDATYTRFGFWTELHHGGDHAAAARSYRHELNGTAAPATSETHDSAPTTNGPKSRDRPSIVHNGRQLDDLTTQAISALQTHNNPPSMFVRAGQLTRLRQDEEERPLIETMRAEHVRSALAEAAWWFRTTKDQERTATSPPLDVATATLIAGTWPFPALAGVVELPVLRPDGTFVTDHGYDPATRLYHWHRGKPYPPVPEQPTSTNLAAAVNLVDDILSDFPWDTSADRANAWGLLLTPLIRPLVGQVPMALVDAPEPGTGKGLLVKIGALITIGRAAALMAWPTSDEELEKKVTAALMAGNTMIIWDNVEGMIRSSTLAAVLTADSWQGRILGRSEMVMVPNRATWAATGNNIDVGGDLARRCYRIRLDAHQAQPWKRTGFRHMDLDGYVAEHRPQLLHALCTIVRSWWNAGRPLAANIAAMGGYTAWVRTVGGILDHAGVGDFLANLDEFHATADREAGAWEAFLTAWSDHLGEQPVTVAELIAKMGDIYSGHKLRDVLPDDLSGYWDTPGFARRLGHALRKRSGRHYGDEGLHLVEMPRDRRQVVIYSVTSRSMTLFASDEVATNGDGVRGMLVNGSQHPARAEPLTCDDATGAGFAGSFPATPREKSYPQAEKKGDAVRKEPAKPATRAPITDDDLFGTP